MQKKKSGVKKCLEILPLRGGGVGRLMENAILNFHFDFLNPSLINSLKALCTTKYISPLKPFEQVIKDLQSFSPRNAQKHIFPFPLQDYHKSLATASCSGHHKYSFAKSLTISNALILKLIRQIIIKNMRAILLPNPHAVSKSSHKRMMTRNMFPA